MVEKVDKLKILYELIGKLNKVDNNTQDCLYGVYSYFVRKLTHFLFITINEQLLSIHNVVCSNE